MAYAGYIVKVGSYTIPNSYIAYESYKISPNQVMDLDSGRDTTGVLHRNVLSHTATKIEFNTPDFIRNDAWNTLWTNISSQFSRGVDAADRQRWRTASVNYYNPLTDGYETKTCYMPDPQLNIAWVDPKANDPIPAIAAKHRIVKYHAVRLAFIEY